MLIEKSRLFIIHFLDGPCNRVDGGTACSANLCRDLNDFMYPCGVYGSSLSGLLVEGVGDECLDVRS